MQRKRRRICLALGTWALSTLLSWEPMSTRKDKRKLQGAQCLSQTHSHLGTLGRIGEYKLKWCRILNYKSGRLRLLAVICKAWSDPAIARFISNLSHLAFCAHSYLLPDSFNHNNPFAHTICVTHHPWAFAHTTQCSPYALLLCTCLLCTFLSISDLSTKENPHDTVFQKYHCYFCYHSCQQ